MKLIFAILLWTVWVPYAEAQEAAIVTQPGATGSISGGQLAPNTLLLGSSTGFSYDSNALNSQPAVGNMQYMVYPQIGLSLARPRWDALINLMPGFTYSSANLPQYQGISLKSEVALQYRVSQRLSLSFTNEFVSSSNPFDSLSASSTGTAGNNNGAPSVPLDYIPKANEYAAASATYSLSHRNSLTASASYNYLSYQHNSSNQALSQFFEQSNGGQVSIAFGHSFSPRHSASLLYTTQILDSGKGQIRTMGQSIQYALQYTPTSSLQLSAMIGPEFAQNSYIFLPAANAPTPNQSISGWLWIGSAAIAWTRADNTVSASASQFLSQGNQYQGNVRQDQISVGYDRRLTGTCALSAFASYSINKPIFVFQSLSLLSNNYLSTGTTLSKTFAERWLLKASYWYLFQEDRGTITQPYSGTHNRMAVTLSYAVSKPLDR